MSEATTATVTPEAGETPEAVQEPATEPEAVQDAAEVLTEEEVAAEPEGDEPEGDEAAPEAGEDEEAAPEAQPEDGIPGNGDDDLSHEGEDAVDVTAGLDSGSQEALGELLDALPDEKKAEIGLLGDGDGEEGPTSEFPAEGTEAAAGTEEPASTEGTPASTPDGDDGNSEGEADGAPPAVFQPGGEPEAPAEAAAPAAPVFEFKHEGHQAWSMMPSRRTAPLARLRGMVYVIAGVNPPAQWEHNGRMVRAAVPAQPVEGWELGKVVSLMHIKTHAWTGDWKIIGIAVDGVLTEGSKTGYRGNAGVDVALKEKAGIWWVAYAKGDTLPDKALLLPDPGTQQAAPAEGTTPETPAQDAPEAPAEAPEGDAAPEGTTPDGDAQPEASAEDTGGDNAAATPRAGRGGRNRGQRNRLRSSREGAGLPA